MHQAKIMCRHELDEAEIKTSAKSKKVLLKLLGIREAVIYPVCSTHEHTLNPQIRLFVFQ
jgi:hypothetical protein